MLVNVLQNVLAAGGWLEPGVQRVSDALGEHLIEHGLAERYETKVQQVAEKKPLPASQAAPVSKKKTVRRSKAAAKSSR